MILPHQRSVTGVTGVDECLVRKVCDDESNEPKILTTRRPWFEGNERP